MKNCALTSKLILPLKTVDCLKCESSVHYKECATSDTQGDGHYHLIISAYLDTDKGRSAGYLTKPNCISCFKHGKLLKFM